MSTIKPSPAWHRLEAWTKATCNNFCKPLQKELFLEYCDVERLHLLSIPSPGQWGISFLPAGSFRPQSSPRGSTEACFFPAAAAGSLRMTCRKPVTHQNSYVNRGNNKATKIPVKRLSPHSLPPDKTHQKPLGPHAEDFSL